MNSPVYFRKRRKKRKQEGVTSNKPKGHPPFTNFNSLLISFGIYRPIYRIDKTQNKISRLNKLDIR